MNDIPAKPPLERARVRLGILLSLVGLLVFVLGAAPQWFGLDRSAVIGFVQIAVFLIGLAIICIGGFICLDGLRNGMPRTLAQDIGLRLVSTGLVIAIFTGMADVFGFGSEVTPVVPLFGFWQTVGVAIGELVIGVGLILLIPRPVHTEKVN
jgi:hypothetical protein